MCDTLDKIFDSFTGYLETHGESTEIDYIKQKGLEDDFLKFYRDQKDTVRPTFEKPKRDHNILTWGKYKGKDINDIHKFDDKYVKWLSQNPYTSFELKEIIKKLCK